MTSPTGGPQARIPLVDLARSASILMVLGFHLALGCLFLFPHRDLATVTWFCFSRHGAYGVTLFFVISGFLISKVLIGGHEDYQNIRLKDFYLRRAARVLPLLALTLVIGAVFLSIHTNTLRMIFCFRAREPTVAMWVSIATFTFNWLRHLPAFGLHWDVLWSLSVEEQFYLFYPLLLRRTRFPANTIRWLVGFVIGGPLIRAFGLVFPGHQSVASIGQSFASFDAIAIGCLLFFADRALSLRGCSRLARQLLMAAGFLLVGGIYLLPHPSGLQTVYVPSLLALGLFFFLLGGLGLTVKPSFPLRALCFPGKLSYGLYLLHTAVLYLSWPLFHVSHPWTSFLLFVLLRTAVAALSFWLYEKPVNSWILSRYAGA